MLLSRLLIMSTRLGRFLQVFKGGLGVRSDQVWLNSKVASLLMVRTYPEGGHTQEPSRHEAFSTEASLHSTNEGFLLLGSGFPDTHKNVVACGHWLVC
jgi:hypothetical protein